MIRIDVVNDPRERWLPLIERGFQMTLAPFRGAIRSLAVELVRRDGPVGGGRYTCTLSGTTALGRRINVVSDHECGEQAVVQAFTRARRELRRGRLRSPLLPSRARPAVSRLS